ncbi:MAG: citrate synthase [Actinobacteria bacterium]|nr:citrate synthase [Actinomycetota bacterium]
MNAHPVPLTSGQAAARLGVRTETLYAYVSRGQISRTRTARGSFFDPLEIEAFAAQRSRLRLSPPASGRVHPGGAPLMVLDTDVALIEDDQLFFRGEPVASLARGFSFDAVAAWLWGEPLHSDRHLLAPPEFVAVARRLVASLPSGVSWIDRAGVALRGLAVADPLRHDGGRQALARVGEIVVSGVVRAMVDRPEAVDQETVPATLWAALTGSEPQPHELTAINAAMVLSADHDLAASTFAGRVAASARASGYGVLTAALGAFDSPLHGTASQAAAQLLTAVRRGRPAQDAIRAQLQTSGRPVPGFGHPLYTGTDPRAATLLPLVAEVDRAGDVIAAVDELIAAMAVTGLHPNIDLALGALTSAAGMSDDAGALVFGMGRTAGWIAHAMDEYSAEPMRLRPQGRYVGPPAVERPELS